MRPEEIIPSPPSPIAESPYDGYPEDVRASWLAWDRGERPEGVQEVIEPDGTDA